MKHILILTIILFASCSNPVDPVEEDSYDSEYTAPVEKQIITYKLDFEAIHSASQTSSQQQGAYFYVDIEDKDGNIKFKMDGIIYKKRTNFSCEAISGDKVTTYVSVYSAYCEAITMCYINGNLFTGVHTDNLFLDETSQRILK